MVTSSPPLRPVPVTGAQRVKVALDRVRREYRTRSTGTIVALDDVSFEVYEGELVAIVGPSGCGKSTLLRIVADLQEPSAGTVTVATTDPGRPRTAMVFQEHALFPWLTVEENVAFGPRNRGVPRGQCEELAYEQLRRMGLLAFAGLYPHQLSGGMRQRVGIARALAQDPEVLLMDEPLGSLDAQTRTLLQEQILDLREQASITCLYVTHAIDEAVLLADRVLLMTARPGRVKEEVTVAFPRPRTLDLRGNPEFAALSQSIWNHLRAEVEAAMAADHRRP